MLDLIVHNGLIVTKNGVFEGYVGAKDGLTAVMGCGMEEIPEARKVIDAEGKFVFPGLIDPHVHAWDPGKTHRDDWFHITQAAAAGGVTTVVEHPLSIPPVKNVDAFKLKLASATEKSNVDFALWGALTPDNMNELDHLYAEGCVAFKGFISYCNEDYPSVTDSVLFEALKISREKGYLLAVHAENAEMAATGEELMKRLGRKDPLAHMNSRENIVELEAINRVIFFAEQTGGRIHIVHMTIAEGAELIKQAKHRGVKITAETCPHYIAADCGLLEERGPFAKCTPPLRRPENTLKMWDYIKDGTIDMVTSDHTDYLFEEKAAARENIWDCENGMTGVATLAPVTIDACMHKHGMGAERVAQLLSTSAAKLFGLYPRKGVILPGSDADYTIVDIEKEWVIDGKKLYYKHGWSPFDGMKVKGAIDRTILRGRVIFEDGCVKSERGFGQFINPRKLLNG